MDHAIKEWASKLKARLPSIRGKLLQDNGIPHPELLEVVDAVDRTFLFDGYEKYFSELVPRGGPISLSHNDAQENNILMSLADNEKIILIDYEYGGWNPFVYDLANYIDECMLDNAYPKGVGVKVYYNNLPTAPEREILYRAFLEHYYNNYAPDSEKVEGGFEAYWESMREQVDREVKQCLLLNNFYWCIWALTMLQDSDVCREDVFNYEFAKICT